MSKNELKKVVRYLKQQKHIIPVEKKDNLEEIRLKAEKTLEKVEKLIEENPEKLFYKLIRLLLILTGYPYSNFTSSDVLKFASEIYEKNKESRLNMYLMIVAYQRQNQYGFFGKKATDMAHKFSGGIPLGHNKNIFMIYVLGRDRSKKQKKRGELIYNEVTELKAQLDDLEGEEKSKIVEIMCLALNSAGKYEESIELAKSTKLFNAATLAAYANLEKYKEALDLVVEHKLVKKGYKYGELLLFGRTIPNDPFIDLIEGVHPEQEKALRELSDQFKSEDQYLFIKPLPISKLFSEGESEKYAMKEMLPSDVSVLLS